MSKELKPNTVCFIKGYNKGQKGFPFNGHVVTLVGREVAQISSTPGQVNWVTDPPKLLKADGHTFRILIEDAHLYPIDGGPVDDECFSQKHVPSLDKAPSMVPVV